MSLLASDPNPTLTFYDRVLRFLLISGLIQLPFAAGLVMSHLNLFNFAGFGEIVETIAFIVEFWLAFLLFLGWIPALYLLFRFRSFWKISVPSLLLVGSTITFLLTAYLGYSKWEDAIGAIGLFLYSAAAFGSGLAWAMSRKQNRGRNMSDV